MFASLVGAQLARWNPRTSRLDSSTNRRAHPPASSGGVTAMMPSGDVTSARDSRGRCTGSSRHAVTTTSLDAIGKHRGAACGCSCLARHDRSSNTHRSRLRRTSGRSDATWSHDSIRAVPQRGHVVAAASSTTKLHQRAGGRSTRRYRATLSFGCHGNRDIVRHALLLDLVPGLAVVRGRLSWPSAASWSSRARVSMPRAGERPSALEPDDHLVAGSAHDRAQSFSSRRAARPQPPPMQILLYIPSRGSVHEPQSRHVSERSAGSPTTLTSATASRHQHPDQGTSARAWCEPVDITVSR